jgi:arylsulfatase A-like enzyme
VISVQALLAALLVAAMDVWLVQWTSHAVPPSTVAIDFVVSGVVLTIVILPVIAALAVFRQRAGPRAFLLAIVPALGFYDLSRVRTEKMSWLDPTSLALAGILAIGCWRAMRPPASRGTGGLADLVWAQALVAATAVTWAALHVQSFAPTIVVLTLLGLVTALQVACSRWVLAAEGPGTRRSTLAALSSLAVAIGFSMVSYPIRPGAPKLQMRPDDGATKAAPGNLPSVIVIVMDTVRADHLSVYGYEHPTSPRLAEFAEHAYVFRRAIANSNWSLPSHATLLTGLLPHQHGAHTVISSTQANRERGEATFGQLAHQPLSPSENTIAYRLRELGYETGLIAANYAWLSDDWGLTRGFHYLMNRPRYLVAWEPFCAAYLRHAPIGQLAELNRRSKLSKLSADQIVAQVTDFLSRQKRGPFFLFVNFMDAHAPYASAKQADAVPEIRERLRGRRWNTTTLEAYDRSIAFLDDQLGRLFGELQTRGLFEESLIVITSDHGERFGVNKVGVHGDDLSQDLLSIPLLIKMPRQAEGERVERWAQLADVAPTILEAVGLPIPREFFGSPLARASRAVIAENYLSSGGTDGYTLPDRGPARFVSMETIDETLPTQWALFDGHWKLVRDGSGRESLYDLSDHADGSENLAARHPEIAREMAERLAALVPPGLFANHRVPVVQAGVSSLAIEKLKSLGYAQ